MKGVPVDPYGPILFADHRAPPTLIIQGEVDTLTPLALSRTFCARINRPQAPCTVVMYRKLGHYFTRNVKDHDGQLNLFATTSDDPTEIDQAAMDNSQKRFVDFMTSRGFVGR